MSFQIKRNWTSCMTLGDLYCCIVLFCTIPHLRQLFRRMPQLWFAVKLQKCYVDYET